MRQARIASHRSKWRAAALALSCLVAGGLAGCGDEAPNSATRTAAGDTAPHKIAWLETGSALSPAQWLASRGEPAPLSVSDPRVKQVEEQLGAARLVYHESERMIANRAVQLSDMLHAISINESPTTIIADLTRVAGAVDQTEGFGAISQYYYNLRAASTSRLDALATLKTRYGPKS